MRRRGAVRSPRHSIAAEGVILEINLTPVKYVQMDKNKFNCFYDMKKIEQQTHQTPFLCSKIETRPSDDAQANIKPNSWEAQEIELTEESWNL